MTDPGADEADLKNTALTSDRKMINAVYIISLISLILPLILLGKAYSPFFFEWGKKDFMERCTKMPQIAQANQAKASADSNRTKQLETDICENIIWKNDVASGISWAWNLLFILIPIASTVILAVESNSKLKAVFLAIASASTVLVSKTEVDQWKFQNHLAGEGRILVSRLNYGANTNQEFEKMVKEYQNLISRSSIGQSPIKSDLNSSPSPNPSPSSF